MAISKLSNGKWQVQVFPNGRDGKRIRRQFVTKGEAQSYEKFVKDQAQDKPWLREKTDKRRVIELVELWFNTHGITLADGEKRRTTMAFACEAMGNPLATEFNAKIFAAYREQRLSGKITRSSRVKTVTPRTVNLELAYFRAMFNELRRLDEFEEIRTLLAECEKSRSKDLATIVKICLATGARWSEAEGLQGNQIRSGQIIYVKTKGKKNRAVPINDKLQAELPSCRKAQSLFKPCYSAFRKAMQRAGIDTPAGQLTHVLRHTFASHLMMNGGNILVLQRILGHTDIKITMRYAHFAPEHLLEAVSFNPLNRMEL